jgi:NAD(P)-dependent dehydrogenase (short-subunit alcohol dehydrogenase family)
MSGRLDGKVCIITGTGGGMGRAAAHVFCREGALVVGCDVNEASGRAALQEVTATGGTMVSVQPCNLAHPAQCQALVEFAIRSFGRIDVLYNNAAKAYFNWIEDVSDAEWRANLSEELDLVFYLTRAAWPYLKETRGVIVNTASASAWRTFTNLGAIAHSTAKAGVVAMTRHMAMEGRQAGIRANSISPGVIVSAQSSEQLKDQAWADYMLGRILLNRFGEPAEIAKVALFLASAESSYVTGADIVADGGMLAC